MHVLIVFDGVIPAATYGGTERVIWGLGKALSRLGHRVSYLVARGSTCDFAPVHIIDPVRPLAEQIPAGIDVVHGNGGVPPGLSQPHLTTVHGNRFHDAPFDVNTVFVSRQHAQRYGSDCYVYNGLDWEEYGALPSAPRRDVFHFLAKASWKVKNLRGAVQTITRTRASSLWVLGGHRISFNMGFRCTCSRRARFHGMVGGDRKLGLIGQSAGLLFPVVWHEPFGLAVIESLYLGCPVFATPYGSLPELVSPQHGHLSANAAELAAAMEDVEAYDRYACHCHARDNFNAEVMARAYITCYQQVLVGTPLNPRPPRLRPEYRQRMLPWVNGGGA